MAGSGAKSKKRRTASGGGGSGAGSSSSGSKSTVLGGMGAVAGYTSLLSPESTVEQHTRKALARAAGLHGLQVQRILVTNVIVPDALREAWVEAACARVASRW